MSGISEIPSPCFLLDEPRLLRNLKLISRVREDAGVEVILAFKGFAMWSTFPLLKNYIAGATASSFNEALLCKEEIGVKAHTYCVAYEDDSFDQIAALSSHLTFNSNTQYDLFKSRVPGNVSVGLRVNPGWSDVTTDLYNPSDSASRLGISKINELPSGVEGLHFHVLCESDSFALEKVLESFERKFGHLLAKVKWVNMGGGHLMTGEGYDVDHLIGLLKRFKEKHKVEIILEPGSAFAWQAGDLHTTILDIIENGGVKTAIIDASFTCHMPDCLEMPYRPSIQEADSSFHTKSFEYRIGGVSCLAGDYLDSYWFDKELKIGDRLIFEDMIHYTMVKTNFFNGVRHPSIGILENTGKFRLVKEFGYEEFKSKLS